MYLGVYTGLINDGGSVWIGPIILLYYSMGKTFKASVDWLGMVENPNQDVNPSVNAEMAQGGQLRKFQKKGEVEPLFGTQEQIDSYGDSLNLYNAYRFQINNSEKNDPDYEPSFDIWEGSKSDTSNWYKSIKDSTKKGFTSYDEYKKANADFDNFVEKYPDNWYDLMKKEPYKSRFAWTDSAATFKKTKDFKKLNLKNDYNKVKYYESLKFSNPNDVAIGRYSSADIGHRKINPVDTYWGGKGYNPIYKKPVQPYVLDTREKLEIQKLPIKTFTLPVDDLPTEILYPREYTPPPPPPVPPSKLKQMQDWIKNIDLGDWSINTEASDGSARNLFNLKLYNHYRNQRKAFSKNNPLDFINPAVIGAYPSDKDGRRGRFLGLFDEGAEIKLSVGADSSHNCGPGLKKCGDTEGPVTLQRYTGLNYNPGNKNFGMDLDLGTQFSFGPYDTRSGAPVLQMGLSGSGSINPKVFKNPEVENAFNYGVDAYGKLGYKKRSLSSSAKRTNNPGFEAGVYGNYDLLNKNINDVGVYGGYGGFNANLGYNPLTKGINAGIGYKFQTGGQLPRFDYRGEWHTHNEKDNGYMQIKDDRKTQATTNKPVRPTVDLKGGYYRTEIINGIINRAMELGVDPHTALAVGLQESALGETHENIGQVLNGNPDWTDYDIDPYFFVNVLKEKMDLGKKHEKDELRQIQYYNGADHIYPYTENELRNGKDTKMWYGVPVPPEGIDMMENPLYGTQIVDLRDNILKKNEVINNYIKSWTPGIYEQYLEDIKKEKELISKSDPDIISKSDPDIKEIKEIWGKTLTIPKETSWFKGEEGFIPDELQNLFNIIRPINFRKFNMGGSTPDNIKTDGSRYNELVSSLEEPNNGYKYGGQLPKAQEGWENFYNNIDNTQYSDRTGNNSSYELENKKRGEKATFELTLDKDLNSKMSDEDFRVKYGTNRHTMRMKYDTQYREKVEKNAIETSKSNGTIKSELQSNLDKMGYNPNSQWMVGASNQQNASPEQKANTAAFHNNVIGAVVPIPGLEALKLTNALKLPGLIDDAVFPAISKVFNKSKVTKLDDVGNINLNISDANWANVNTEILTNTKLLEEYDYIEKITKARGTWMKNADGTPFTLSDGTLGTPEQFIQLKSQNFNISFPAGYESIYRGVPNSRNSVVELKGSIYPIDQDPRDILRRGKDFKNSGLFAAGSPDLAAVYARDDNGFIHNLAIQNSPNSLVIEGLGNDWTNLSSIGMKKETILKNIESIKSGIKEDIKAFKDKKFGEGVLESSESYHTYMIAMKEKTLASYQRFYDNYDEIVANPLYQKLVKDKKQWDTSLEFNKPLNNKNQYGRGYKTDHLAEFLEKNGLDHVKINDLDDAGFGDVFINNQKPGNYAKSMVHNNGMFDLTNPLPTKKYGGQNNFGLDLKTKEYVNMKTGKEIKSDDIYSTDRYSKSAKKYKRTLVN